MSPEPQTYHFPPTRLIPNSPDPLLYYPSFFSSPTLPTLASIHSHFTSHTWTPQWIFRYGSTQASHYHSRTHECMVVLSGHARIRFGVADAAMPMEEGSEIGRQGGGGEDAGKAGEVERTPHAGHDEEGDGGIEIDAHPGDVFVLPAGVAHKTFATQPAAPFALLTPGEARGFSREEAEGLDGEAGGDWEEGFTMMGAYPRGAKEWDFRVGGEDVGAFDGVWGVRRPEMDPVLGLAREGLVGLWRG